MWAWNAERIEKSHASSLDHVSGPPNFPSLFVVSAQCRTALRQLLKRLVEFFGEWMAGQRPYTLVVLWKRPLLISAVTFSAQMHILYKICQTGVLMAAPHWAIKRKFVRNSHEIAVGHADYGGTIQTTIAYYNSFHLHTISIFKMHVINFILF